MKRAILLFLVLVLIFGMFVVNSPVTVTAYSYTPTPTVVNVLPLAPNAWSGGNETSIDLSKYPAPTWLQMVANPVKITTTEKVCHEFRAGQYFWTPEIRQLIEGKWVKVEFTAGWFPSTEGKFEVCFKAVPGTYALFGYYNPPANLPAQVVEPTLPF